MVLMGSLWQSVSTEATSLYIGSESRRVNLEFEWHRGIEHPLSWARQEQCVKGGKQTKQLPDMSVRFLVCQG